MNVKKKDGEMKEEGALEQWQTTTVMSSRLIIYLNWKQQQSSAFPTALSELYFRGQVDVTFRGNCESYYCHANEHFPVRTPVIGSKLKLEKQSER